MKHYRINCLIRTACFVSIVLFLAGCAGNNTVDLERYIKVVSSQQHPRVEPLPEFVPYETFLYRAEKLRDPFTLPATERSTAIARAPDNGISPQVGRRRDPLEAYSLDSLRMVGTMDRESNTWALVRAADGAIHRVQLGNHLGKNYGKIDSISEHKLHITEIVPDGLGGWIERAASLRLGK